MHLDCVVIDSNLTISFLETKPGLRERDRENRVSILIHSSLQMLDNILNEELVSAGIKFYIWP